MASTLHGTGFAFPILPRDGVLPRVSGTEAVAQALRVLLHTEPGERIGRPTYGVGLRRFLFAPNTVTTRSGIRRAILEAIARDEPRVRPIEVLVLSAEDDPARLEIDLQYTLIDTPVPQNLVYPFYLDGRTAPGGI